MEDHQSENPPIGTVRVAGNGYTQVHVGNGVWYPQTKETDLTSLGDQAQTLAARMGQLQVRYDWDTLRAQALADKLIQEETDRQKQRELKMEDYWKILADSLLGACHNTKLVPTDPDGALTPLPVKPAPTRTVAAPSHDFIGALYKPYFSPI